MESSFIIPTYESSLIYKQKLCQQDLIQLRFLADYMYLFVDTCSKNKQKIEIGRASIINLNFVAIFLFSHLGNYKSYRERMSNLRDFGPNLTMPPSCVTF
jgi:hypothetical protein